MCLSSSSCSFYRSIAACLELLKIKILLVSFSPAVNVGDNLLVVEFNAPSINFLAVPSFTLHPCNVVHVTTSPI